MLPELPVGSAWPRSDDVEHFLNGYAGAFRLKMRDRLKAVEAEKDSGQMIDGSKHRFERMRLAKVVALRRIIRQLDELWSND